MATRKSSAVAFIAILIAAGLVAFVTRVEAQTIDEQKQALIGEWTGVWPGMPLWPEMSQSTVTLIIHEIDTAKAKAQCTYTSSEYGEKKYPLLADFTPGANPKLEFKVEGKDYEVILKDKVLQATFRGVAQGMSQSNSTKMVKKPQK